MTIQRALAHVLNPEKKAEEKSKQSARRAESGPAQYDRYLTLFSDQKDSFIEPPRVVPVGLKREKIIFCHAMLAGMDENDISLLAVYQLVQHFIQYHDVVLWPGSGRALIECTPETHTTDFWKKLFAMPPATREDVLKALADQGIAASDYLIIGYPEFAILYNRYVAQFSFRATLLSGNTVSMKMIRQYYADILKRINPSHIEKILISDEYIYLTSEEINFIKTNFPNAVLVFSGFSYGLQKWINKCQRLQKKALKLF